MHKSGGKQENTEKECESDTTLTVRRNASVVIRRSTSLQNEFLCNKKWL